MIIVTGATGQLGREVVDGLLEHVPAPEVGVSVRDPGKASAWAERGVRVRRGDFRDPDSLRDAFAGATQVMIVSVNDTGSGAVAQHGNAIAAAKAAGAERILYTSHQGASPESAFGPARDHAATEELLRASGVAFTSLRNGFYTESALWQMGQLLETHRITLPADGPVSWTARTDLAGAAVAALLHPDQLSGITPPLTGPEALDFATIAQMAAEILGAPVSRETLADDVYRQSLIDTGLPPAMADLFLGMFVAARRGEFAAPDPTLARVLGRPTTPMRHALAEFLTEPAAHERSHT